MVQNTCSDLQQPQVGDGTDSIITVYNTYGQIWEEASKAEAANTATELQLAEVAVNNGIGYGWQWQSIDNIVVDNHSLVIGMTTNSTYTKRPLMELGSLQVISVLLVLPLLIIPAGILLAE